MTLPEALAALVERGSVERGPATGACARFHLYVPGVVDSDGWGSTCERALQDLERYATNKPELSAAIIAAAEALPQ